MKKATVTGIVILCIGAIAAFIGLCGIGFDFKRISTEPPAEIKEYSALGAIGSIKLSAESAKIVIVPSEGGVKVDYPENDCRTYTVSEEGGVLTVRSVFRGKWYQRIFQINFETRTLRIALPKNSGINIEAASGNGSISVSELSLGTLILNSDNGKISLKNIICRSSYLKSSNGRITLEGVRTVNGGNITAAAANGKLSLKDISSNFISAKASNGYVELLRVDAPTIELRSANGAVIGSVCRDMKEYYIKSSAENGKNNLPKSQNGANRRLEVYADNGRIDIAFNADDPQAP